jgi:outer membrane protein assembly factor BamB
MDQPLTALGHRPAYASGALLLAALGALVGLSLWPGLGGAPSSQPDRPAAGWSFAPATAQPVSASSSAQLRGIRLLDRSAVPNEAVLVVDPSGRLLARLPLTVDDVRAGTGYLARASGSDTRVVAMDLANGEPLRSMELQGTYRSPIVARDGLPRGLSHDGRTLVLEEVASDTRDGPIVSRFALVDTSFARAPRLIELPGRFSFDAIAPTGKILYLVEHLPTTRPTDYQVRAYDLVAGALRPNIVVDKLAGRLLMQGDPLMQVSSSDGRWVYTLYRNGHHGPFIHALDTVQASALCHFLSEGETAAHDPGAPSPTMAAESAWTLALSADDQQLVAANPALGLFLRIDTQGRPTVTRSTFDAAALAMQAMPTSAALDRANGRLYLATDAGVLVQEATRPEPGKQFLDGRSVSSLWLDVPSGRLYAHDTEGDEVVVLDASTGGQVATYPALGADLLLGSLP